MRRKIGLAYSMATLVFLGCSDAEVAFHPDDPARGPGRLVGNNEALNETFEGGASTRPDSMNVAPPSDESHPACGPACRAYCEGLELPNPLDRGLCKSAWGLGLDTQPVDRAEACRRLHVDMLGYFPTYAEVKERCGDRPWSQVVADLMAEDAFVDVNRRHWADRLLYNNTAVSVERIYDMDLLVGKLYRGRVAYDEFAAVVSAHPVLTRRYDNASDIAEALFDLFLGRPPYENERSDMARLYGAWGNGYYDHPKLGRRLPDATVRYRCLNEQGDIDPSAKGECTSVLWGYNELILEPDFRARDGEMWSGLLTVDEWEKLQLPGRIIASELGFWEHAAGRVLEQYLGYDLGSRAPAVRDALVEYMLAHHGDIRAAHYAVASSQVYLQSSEGSTPTTHPWTYGPLKQVQVEPWIDTIKRRTGYSLSRCDHRIPQPGELLNEESVAAYAMVDRSNWELDDEGEVRGDYRDLARTLGGCPENETGGRFTTVSILTTATQQGFVADVCNPQMEPDAGADVATLLPDGIQADHALDRGIAEDILRYQTQTFFGRQPKAEEIQLARDGYAECAPKPCAADAFARPVCYALLSSAEMLFY